MMHDRYREEDLAHRVAEQMEREEREAREKAGGELARLIFETKAGFSGSEEVVYDAAGDPGDATPAQAKAEDAEASLPSVDAGVRSKPMRMRRTPGQQMYLAIFGHDHDDVPPWIDNPPAA